MKCVNAAKVLFIDIEPGTAQRIQANLPEEYIIRKEKSSVAMAILQTERPDLVIFGTEAAADKLRAEFVNGKDGRDPVPAIILSGSGTGRTTTTTADEGTIYRCSGDPLDIPQIKECVRKVFSATMRSPSDSALPADVEILIEHTVDELVNEDAPLEKAIQKFTARFAEMFSGRCKK